MSNRLQLFRERMAAFEGAANPQQAIENGYYVQAPLKLLAETIQARVALRPTSSHLLIGGLGSGKTTQLLFAAQNLKQIEDIHPIYIDVSLYTDIYKISAGALTAIAGLELSKLVYNNADEDINHSIQTIRNIAYGYTTIVRKDTLPTVSSMQFERIEHQGVIPPKSNSNIGNLVNAVSKVVAAAKKVCGHIVLLFDGLDRLNDSKIFAEIIASDVINLSNANIGIVVVGPLVSLYGDYSTSIKNEFNYFYHQPCFDIENDQEANNFFRKILKNRSKSNFIEHAAIDLLIKFSGGVLRDLISLTQASIEETYMSGDDMVEQKHVLIAVNSFGRAQILSITEEELEILRKAFEIGKFIPKTNKDVKLLANGHIIEYRYTKIRYAVHPTIIPLVEQRYATR